MTSNAGTFSNILLVIKTGTSDLCHAIFTLTLFPIRFAVTRRAVSWIGVGEPGYSGATDVVRYFGMSNSCVTRMLSTGVKPDIDDIILDL